MLIPVGFIDMAFSRGGFTYMKGFPTHISANSPLPTYFLIQLCPINIPISAIADAL